MEKEVEKKCTQVCISTSEVIMKEGWKKCNEIGELNEWTRRDLTKKEVKQSWNRGVNQEEFNLEHPGSD